MHIFLRGICGRIFAAREPSEKKSTKRLVGRNSRFFSYEEVTMTFIAILL